MKNFEKKIIKSSLDLQKTIKTWKKNNQKIVFTNGCFDILHLGHIKTLSESKKLGDKLVVGLNNDESVKVLKGKNRPVNNNYHRSMMLAALSFVDLVVFFEEDTPYNLIKLVLPNIITKGGDYEKKDVIGGDLILSKGGQINIIPLLPNLSSSKLIRKYKL
ncbi:D-glycero-beta-D-manno-heptose 1-phosphate adenylyltransferase [Bacteroidota bacterium]|nr:D-glycero-beta-D-manno-heptose 1-phosphate adenylyltransferase [Bacteroidota bacterium]